MAAHKKQSHSTATWETCYFGAIEHSWQNLSHWIVDRIPLKKASKTIQRIVPLGVCYLSGMLFFLMAT